MSKKTINAKSYTTDYTGKVRSFYKREVRWNLEHDVDHIIYRNNKGRGLSIIKEDNYWNVAVLKFWGKYGNQYHVDYTTPLTNFVLHITDIDEVVGLLQVLQDIDRMDFNLIKKFFDILRGVPREGKQEEVEEFYRGY